MALLTMLFSSIVTLFVLPPLLYIRGNCTLSCSLLLPGHFVNQASNFEGMNYLKRNFFKEDAFVWDPPRRCDRYLKRIF